MHPEGPQSCMRTPDYPQKHLNLQNLQNLHAVTPLTAFGTCMCCWVVVMVFFSLSSFK